MSHVDMLIIIKASYTWQIGIIFVSFHCPISYFLLSITDKVNYPFCFIVFRLQISYYILFKQQFVYSNLLTKDYIMDLVYDGCIAKNANGTNKIIGPGEKYLVPTDKCFWKDPREVRNCRVKARSCTKNNPTVSIKECDTYVCQREWINRWALGIEQKES